MNRVKSKTKFKTKKNKEKNKAKSHVCSVNIGLPTQSIMKVNVHQKSCTLGMLNPLEKF